MRFKRYPNGVAMTVASPDHVAQVRSVLMAMVPAGATGLREMPLRTRCHGCPDHYCPSDPPVMVIAWKVAPQ